MYVDNGSIAPRVDPIAAYGVKCAVNSSNGPAVPVVLIPLDIVVAAIEGSRNFGIR